MLIKWRITTHSAKIERIECIRESEKSVWVPGRLQSMRREKQTFFEKYFDSWQDARASLLAIGERKVGLARRELELANAFLVDVTRLCLENSEGQNE